MYRSDGRALLCWQRKRGLSASLAFTLDYSFFVDPKSTLGSLFFCLKSLCHYIDSNSKSIFNNPLI